MASKDKLASDPFLLHQNTLMKRYKILDICVQHFHYSHTIPYLFKFCDSSQSTDLEDKNISDIQSVSLEYSVNTVHVLIQQQRSGTLQDKNY